MKIKRSELKRLAIIHIGNNSIEAQNKIIMKICVARAARLSYMTHDGEIDYEKDIKLHDQLLERKHASCFEHCAKTMSEEEYYSMVNGKVPSGNDDPYGLINYEYYPKVFEGAPGHFGMDPGVNPNNGNRFGWCRNLRGFIPYRHIANL